MAVCSKAPGPPTELETEPGINLVVEGNGSKDSVRNCTEGRILGTKFRPRSYKLFSVWRTSAQGLQRSTGCVSSASSSRIRQGKSVFP